jgi:hypothetical protein
MNRLPRALAGLALVVCLALGLLTPGALAAEAKIDYTHESEAAFE